MPLKEKYEEQYKRVSKTFEKIRKHIQKQLEKKYGDLFSIEEKVDSEDVYNLVIEKINKLYPNENKELKDFLGFFYMEYFFRKVSAQMELNEEETETQTQEEEPEYLN